MKKTYKQRVEQYEKEGCTRSDAQAVAGADGGPQERMVYIILETQRTPQGGYIPCIVKEGEKGYYKTDWDWGDNKIIAEELAEKRNEAMGLHKYEAHKLVCRSMF